MLNKYSAKGCDQCEAAMVNGVFCHETGCPNTHKRYNKANDVWETMIKCPICGYDYPEGTECCEVF